MQNINKRIYAHGKRLEFYIQFEAESTAARLRIYSSTVDFGLISDKHGQLGINPITASFNNTPVITDGTASLYLKGTAVYLQYCFKDLGQKHSNTVNLEEQKNTV
ncbi:hypothetical protein C0991_003801 [Blastosporella zonata]|nr:hypothetical protein C0991_005524 [Blastosporella zonata]KAG6839274.1 hypothetical protein C0991_004252 [Blastosporella zonata]KAG6863705.1 hypothetical protein C0991_003801 [Blastosporella zonata]